MDKKWIIAEFVDNHWIRREDVEFDNSLEADAWIRLQSSDAQFEAREIQEGVIEGLVQPIVESDREE